MPKSYIKKSWKISEIGEKSGKIKVEKSGHPVIFYTPLHHWSVGPRRPSDQSDAIVAGCLYM